MGYSWGGSLALYNEAVTVAKRRKLKTKHDWLLHTARRYTHGIMFDIPWHRWVGYGDLKQYDRDGMLRTTITFMLERGELTTSLVKAEAKRLQREISGKITLKPGRHRLNRHFKRCFMYAMGGLDKQGDFVHYRVLLLRAGAELARIEIRSRTAETDPEVEQILATLRPYSLKRGK